MNDKVTMMRTMSNIGGLAQQYEMMMMKPDKRRADSLEKKEHKCVQSLMVTWTWPPVDPPRGMGMSALTK